MKSKRIHHGRSSDSSAESVDNIMNMLFTQAKAQFGNAVKSFWFYDGDLCPACLLRPIGAVKFKGKDSLSLNAFIYRKRGVLIGYFLCETCAVQIFDQAQKHPYQPTPLHAEIESNLATAYHKRLASLDA